MELTFSLGDKVLLDGLKGYWEIVGIESLADSAKRYTLRIKANHKYDCIDCVEFFCCEKTLARIADKLVDNGAININYVGGDPIPNLHTIVGSLNYQQSNICQLWNSNFYLTGKALSLIIDLMDFWLPDFKYGNNECAKKLSGIENYYDIVSRNHKRIHDEGSGEIIIRHLVMPNPR